VGGKEEVTRVRKRKVYGESLEAKAYGR